MYIVIVMTLIFKILQTGTKIYRYRNKMKFESLQALAQLQTY